MTDKRKSRRVQRRAPLAGSADDRRFLWLAKNLPKISYRGSGPDEGLWLEWADADGQHRVVQSVGIHAEDRMRKAIDRAMQNNAVEARRNAVASDGLLGMDSGAE